MRSHQVLDPAMLGRPIHLLRNFSKLFEDEMTEMFRTVLNRRYRAGFEVGEVAMAPLDGDVPQMRWQNYGCTLGRISCAIERKLVLAILTHRYGGAGKSTLGQTPDDQLPPETATEERLNLSLAHQFTDMLVACVEKRHGDDDRGVEQHALKALPPGMPAQAAWVVRVVVREATLGIESALYLTLDAAWMGRLLHNLTPLRQTRRESFNGRKTLPSELPLTVVAQLLQKDIPLGRLLDLQVGDVIPISLNEADVLIDESLLFSATVAEHKGKLCLTCFEDTE